MQSALCPEGARVISRGREPTEVSLGDLSPRWGLMIARQQSFRGLTTQAPSGRNAKSNAEPDALQCRSARGTYLRQRSHSTSRNAL